MKCSKLAYCYCQITFTCYVAHINLLQILSIFRTLRIMFYSNRLWLTFWQSTILTNLWSKKQLIFTNLGTHLKFKSSQIQFDMRLIFLLLKNNCEWMFYLVLSIDFLWLKPLTKQEPSLRVESHKGSLLG